MVLVQFDIDEFRVVDIDVTRPRGYKTFVMLNSVEHEILNVHKYKFII